MSEQKPLGPWYNTSQDDSVVGEVMDQPLDSGTNLLVSIYGPEAKEAACLIAAAPDLLDALIACISGEFATTDKAALAKADAAIARATGESA